MTIIDPSQDLTCYNRLLEYEGYCENNATNPNMYNKTSIFLIPLLELSLNTLNSFNLKNAYLDSHSPKIERKQGCLYLVFNKIKNNNEYEKYLNFLREKKTYIEDYILDNEIIFLFKIPEQYFYEINMFKQGKYSKFRKNEFVYKFYGVNKDNFKICTKDEKFKKRWEKIINTKLSNEDEVHSIPYLNEEIYEYDNKTKKW